MDTSDNRDPGPTELKGTCCCGHNQAKPCQPSCATTRANSPTHVVLWCMGVGTGWLALQNIPLL